MESPSLGTIVLSILCVLLGVLLTVLFQKRGMSDETRQKRIRNKLQNNCPHARILRRHDGTILIDPLFISPPGTVDYICGKCQLVTNEAMATRLVGELSVDEVSRRYKRFNRLMKKHGYI